MAQRTRVPGQQLAHQITAQSSLFQTLVHAGIGCIAFLRGLFDEDSFEDAVLEAPRPVDTSKFVKPKDKDKLDKPSTVRIKKLKKGGCESASKLLEWLETGVSDGIENGYLHRLVFAIYLDPEDPTNLVESYTFTFTYETDQAGFRRADMMVHDQLKGMLLSSTTAYRTREQPHKEGEVKRQVQQVIKNLLTSTQLLDELPRRRFFTLRALWYDHTPDDYKPLHFKPITQDWPDYNLTTTSVHDLPDVSTLGTVQTGYHGVSLHTITISHVLETSFDDTISKEEATARNQKEAATRVVSWNAQSLVESTTDAEENLKVPEPLTIRNLQGQLVPFDQVLNDPNLSTLRKRVGLEADPAKAVYAKGIRQDDILDSNLSDNEVLRRAIAALEKPQRAENEIVTQEDPVVNRLHSYKSPEKVVPVVTDVAGASSKTIDLTGDPRQEDTVMGASEIDSPGKGSQCLNVNTNVLTQMLDFSQRPRAGPLEPSQFESSSDADKVQQSAKKTQEPAIAPQPIARVSQAQSRKKAVRTASDRKHLVRAVKKDNKHDLAEEDEVCECGDPDEDGGMTQCSDCNTWRHNACYGYDDDPTSLPDVFHCYRCRGRSALAESGCNIARKGEIEQALANLKSLALFRRAICVVWDGGVVDSKALAKTLQTDKITAAQLIKRLKSENFLEDARKKPSKFKRGSLGKAVQVVNKSPRQIAYKDTMYFSPGRGAEAPIVASLSGVDEIVSDGESTLQDAQIDKTLKDHQVLVQDTPSPVAYAAPAATVSSFALRDKSLASSQEAIASASTGSSLSYMDMAEFQARQAELKTIDQASEGISDCSTPRISPQDAAVAACLSARGKSIRAAATLSAAVRSSVEELAHDTTRKAAESPTMPEPINVQQRLSGQHQAMAMQIDGNVKQQVHAATVSECDLAQARQVSAHAGFALKRPASPRLAQQQDSLEAALTSSQGLATVGELEERKSKKQKASDAEENLEAE